MSTMGNSVMIATTISVRSPGRSKVATAPNTMVTKRRLHAANTPNLVRLEESAKYVKKTKATRLIAPSTRAWC
jgi:hypothetical protein